MKNSVRDRLLLVSVFLVLGALNKGCKSKNSADSQNNLPEIHSYAPENDFSLGPGSNQILYLEGSDPDNDQTTFYFIVNGDTVKKTPRGFAPSASYTLDFENEKLVPGSNTVKAGIQDPEEKSDNVQWNVTKDNVSDKVFKTYTGSLSLVEAQETPGMYNLNNVINQNYQGTPDITVNNGNNKLEVQYNPNTKQVSVKLLDDDYNGNDTITLTENNTGEVFTLNNITAARRDYSGRIIDAVNESVRPNILVKAGNKEVRTAADGSFKIQPNAQSGIITLGGEGIIHPIEIVYNKANEQDHVITFDKLVELVWT